MQIATRRFRLSMRVRCEGGRYRGHRPDDPGHPGSEALGKIRETELRAAASVLGVREVSLLDYHDQHLDRANPREAVASIVGHLRRVRLSKSGKPRVYNAGWSSLVARRAHKLRSGTSNKRDS